MYLANGIANVPFTIFAASNVQEVTTDLDEDEEIIEQKFLSLGEIETMLQNGEIQDTPTVAAVYLSKIHGLIKEAD